MAKTYYVCILASKQNRTLYIGVTNDLERRMVEHQNGLAEGFIKKYKAYSLVHYEETNDIYAALQREKQLNCSSAIWWSIVMGTFFEISQQAAGN